MTFTVVEGGGSVNGLPQTTLPTTQTGHAGVVFEVGAAGNNRVVVDFVGNTNDPAVFVATGVERGAQPTRFVGVVLNNAELPIEGADVHLTLPGVVIPHVLSGADGSFVIDNIQGAGPGFLGVDGSTAFHVGGSTGGTSVPNGSFPGLHFEVVVTPGTTNSLVRPVLLPPLNPVNTRYYSTTQDIILTIDEITGLQMVIKAGSMTMPDGPAVE